MISLDTWCLFYTIYCGGFGVCLIYDVGLFGPDSVLQMSYFNTAPNDEGRTQLIAQMYGITILVMNMGHLLGLDKRRIVRFHLFGNALAFLLFFQAAFILTETTSLWKIQLRYLNDDA